MIGKQIINEYLKSKVKEDLLSVKIISVTNYKNLEMKKKLSYLNHKPFKKSWGMTSADNNKTNCGEVVRKWPYRY